jgi:tetratricopeptide (TPR) repeat protein
MRKGRSSRRNRISLPLIGAKPPPSTADAVSGDIRPSATSPRVIISVPSSELPQSTPSSIEAKAPFAADEGRVTFDKTLAGVGPSRARGSERPTSPPPNDEGESRTLRSKDLASTVAFGSSATKFEAKGIDSTSDEATKEECAGGEGKAAETETKSAGTAEAKSDDAKSEAKTDAKSEDVEKSEAKDEGAKSKSKGAKDEGSKSSKNEKKRDGAKKKDAEAKAAGEKAAAEASVPPVGDLDDEVFFSDADVSRHLAAESVDATDALTVPDKAKRKAEPAVVERRARFARYVKWAVAAAGVLCLAAVARTSMTSKSAPPPPVAATERAPTSEPAVPKAAEPAATPATTTTERVAREAPPPAAAPTESPSATAAPTAESAATSTPESPAALVTGDAKEEKKKARMLLEQRKVAEAIEAGERGVARDPTDGEAWLILGAAYQEKGNIAAARRAYASCLKEGKSGPRHECAKMLR